MSITKMDVEENNKFLDLDDEILLKIFVLLDNQSLLKATHVCKKFKHIAATAVTDKYNGLGNEGYDLEHKHYTIEVFDGNGESERQQHVPFLVTFGDKISAISIKFYPKNVGYYWIIRLVKKYLHATSKVQLLKSYNNYFTDSDTSAEIYLADFIPCFSKLKTLTVTALKLKGLSWVRLRCPSLVELNLEYVENLRTRSLEHFFSNNRQLEYFSCSNIPTLTIDIFDGMKLKTLICDNDSDSDDKMKFIRETSNASLCNLVVFLTDNKTKTLFEVLATSGKSIEEFTVNRAVEPFEISDHQVDILCSFKQLSKLTMKGVIFNVQQVMKLVAELPHLTKFHFVHSSNISLSDVKNILDVTSHSNISNIRIYFELTIEEDLPSMSEIHQLFIDFAKPHLVLVFYLTNIVEFALHYEIFAITKSQVTMTTDPIEKSKLIRWNRQTDREPFRMNLLQLDDDRLKQIIEFLDQRDLLSLYQSCNRMQLLVGPIFQQLYADESFHIRRTLRETEEYLRCFGTKISRIFFDIKKCIRSPVTSYWKLIHKFCGNNLMELTVKHSMDIYNLSYLSRSGLFFPKLEKLIFQKSCFFIFHHSEMNYSFCPNLVYLECDENTVINATVDIYFGEAFDHLTTLRFEWYNDEVLKFIKNLNDVVCHNLRELTLRNIRNLIDDDNFRYKLDNRIVNAIVRFINLTTLNLIIDGIHQTNVKFLFENCSKLKNLALCHVTIDNWMYGDDTWPIIKKSCLKMEKLQLVVRRLEKPLFSTFLSKLFYMFPCITIEILEIGGTTSHCVNRFIVTAERFTYFDKYPIHSFISGA